MPKFQRSYLLYTNPIRIKDYDQRDKESQLKEPELI